MFYPSGLITLGYGNLQALDMNPNDESFYRLLAHELGHYYWHNEGLSLEWLQGNQWYVEGFTEYAAMWITGRKYGIDAFIRRMDFRVSRLGLEPELKSLDQYDYWEYSSVPYNKGPMMLESLRRMEGEEKLFEFMGRMSQVSESVRTIDDLVNVGQDVFHKDYRSFFTHWVEGVYPVDLGIDSYEIIDGNEVKLRVKSSHSLADPLEIGVSYYLSQDINEFKIEEGINEVIIPLEFGATGIEIDPRRKVFQLSGIYDNPRAFIPLKELTMEEAIALTNELDSPTVRAAREGRELLFDDISFEHWHYVGKKVEFPGYSWELAHFIQDEDSIYAHLVLNGDYEYINEVRYNINAVLEAGHSKMPWPSMILQEKKGDKAHFIIEWRSHFPYNDNFWGGQNYRLIIDDKEDGPIEFYSPVFDSGWAKPIYEGNSVLLGDIVIKTEEVAFGSVGTYIEMSIKGKNEMRPVDIMGFEVVLPDGSHILPSSYSRRPVEDGFYFSINIPFMNEPIPIGVKIKGIEVKKPIDFVSQFMPGGIVWSGLADRVLDWDESVYGKIEAGQGLHVITSGIGGTVNDHLNIDSGVVSVDDVIKIALNIRSLQRVGVSIDAEAILEEPSVDYAYSHESQGVSVLDVEYELEEGESIVVPFSLSSVIVPGWYRLKMEIRTDCGGWTMLSNAGMIYVDYPDTVREAGAGARELVDRFIQYCAEGKEAEAEAIVTTEGSLPHWYTYMKDRASLKDWTIEVIDVSIHRGIFGHTIFRYDMRAHGQNITSSFNMNIVESNGQYNTVM